jgi:hypothetical protein
VSQGDLKFSQVWDDDVQHCLRTVDTKPFQVFGIDNAVRLQSEYKYAVVGFITELNTV